MTQDECKPGVRVVVRKLIVPEDKADPRALDFVGRVGTIARMLPEYANPYPVRVSFDGIGEPPTSFAPEELESV